MQDRNIHLARAYRKKYIWTYLFWAIVLSMGAGLFLNSQTQHEMLREILFLCGGGFAIAFAWILWTGMPLSKQRARIAKHTALMTRPMVAPHMFAPSTLRTDATGIEWRHPLKAFRVEWPGVIRLVESSDHVYIECDDGRGPIIPKAQVEPEKLQKLLTIVAALAGGEHAEEQTISRVLRDRDFSCPDCGYECKGINSNRCPECGRQFTVDDFRLSDSETKRLLDKHLRAKYRM